MSSFSPRSVCLALAALASAALLGCSGESSDDPYAGGVPPTKDVNILILSVDTLRADRLGIYGNDEWGTSPSPTMDSLGAAGVVFDQALVPRGQTRPSIAALFTGKYPITTGLRDNFMLLLPEHVTFMERLQAGGHQTGVFASNFDENSGGKWIYRGADKSRGGSTGAKKMSHTVAQRAWDATVERAALQFFDGIDTERPFAAYVHFYDVHKPFTPPERYDRYGKYDGMPAVLGKTTGPEAQAIEQHIDAITLGDRDVPEAELRRIRGLYDAGVTQVDDRIERILAKLDEIGERDNTVVILTSDHGEELFDRNRYFYHGNSIYNGVVGVPLVISGPGMPQAERRGMPVINMDVTATIYDLVGLPQPSDIEGASLVDAIHGRADSVRSFAFVEWTDVVYAATNGTHSYVHNPRRAHLRKPPFYMSPKSYAIDCFEGYDLTADWLQQDNLLEPYDPSTLVSGSGLPPEYGVLRTALDEWRDDPRHEKELSFPGATPAQAGDIAGENERQMDLVRMGYIQLDGSSVQHVFEGGCDKER